MAVNRREPDRVEAFTIGFQNLDQGASHNVHIRSGRSERIHRREGDGGGNDGVPRARPEAGTYPFICDVHPIELTGTLTVD